MEDGWPEAGKGGASAFPLEPEQHHKKSFFRMIRFFLIARSSRPYASRHAMTGDGELPGRTKAKKVVVRSRNAPVEMGPVEIGPGEVVPVKAVPLQARPVKARKPQHERARPA
jgi:hypothetical protein